MKVYTSILICFLSVICLAQNPKCGTDILLEQEIIKNPDIKQNLDNFYIEFENHKITNNRNNIDSLRIIPVVFHIIHQGGYENIPKSQIMEQMIVLNEDIRRQNSDTINTPSVFAPLGADAYLEFRLAKIDPWGNCTDGINRVYSHTTNGASGSNGVNTAAYWNSNNYLNIWVVNTMENSGTAGYAYLPNTAPTPYHDGIVILHSYIGDSRTLTHEVGHYLGLKHVWGGAAGESFCGDDNVDDTPAAYDANYGCPPFPELNNCEFGDSINGEMFSNYMDYTSDNCQNIFTLGQKGLFDFTLHGNNGTDGIRSNLWSESNLIATGISNNIPASDCLPVPEFTENYRMVCVGQIITFTDVSWKGAIDSRLWTFPGGSPSSSTDSMEFVSYTNPGIYDVTLEVTNGAGTATTTKIQRIIVSNNWANYNSNSYNESFEDWNIFNEKWHIFNQDGMNGWSQYSQGGSPGNKSAVMNNFNNVLNEVDELISPSYNLHNFSNVSLSFKYAGASRTNDPDDKLQIYVSNDCGKTWNLRGSVQYETLANNGLHTEEFNLSSSSIWDTKTLNITSTYISENFRFKFTFTNGGLGNNIYIDNVNLTGTVNLQEFEETTLEIIPNPFKSNSVINFTIDVKQKVNFEILNAFGEKIKKISSSIYNQGNHSLIFNREELPNGVYFLKANFENKSISRKIIIQD